jgi:enoyl-CoA hydratase
MIATENQDGVRVIALDRPPVNALNLELVRAAGEAIRAARQDPTCEAIVLTGAHGVFSGGIDTQEVPGYDPSTRSEMLRTINRLILELYGLPKPAVAAVPGHALGGAFVLVLACDLRLVARGDFRLGLTESAAGIPFPAGPLAIVRAELSPENARILALTALTPRLDALLQYGVIDWIVDPPTLIAEAVKEARRLAAMPAYGRVKEQLRAATCDSLRRIVAYDEEPLHRRWV